MGISHNMKFTPIIIPLLLSLFLHGSVSAQDDDVCAKVDCGQGTCVPDNVSILRFNCVCYGGWKQFQLGSFTLPPCIIPNCTLNFQCGNGATPSPPPPPPPPFDLTNPCNLVWCGDGTCVSNGTGHSCQCTEGSANLLNMTAMACFKQCAFGGDCSGLGLGPGPHAIPPPPSTNGTLTLPAPPLPNGSNNISKSSKKNYTWNMVLLFAMILALSM